MNTDSHSDAELQKFFGMKRIAVVGMSRYAEKAAHTVPKYMLEQGYNVIPVNPSASEILGRKSYPTVRAIPDLVDLVNIFRPSRDVPAVVKDLMKKPRIKVVWMQEGIYSGEAERMAIERGMDVVYNRCIMVEHRRLFGRAD
ncbi:MAG: CoA-binding protein [Nitrososphaera sp.]|nr:CoA-binding protein [Nitrososphaera sp.]